ncbi:MAG: hypothetical protein LR015_07415 [Verrucomicrobia bacterium]|nr:hypothetical protein [Verrucomicrobiota bacterium]
MDIFSDAWAFVTLADSAARVAALASVLLGLSCGLMGAFYRGSQDVFIGGCAISRGFAGRRPRVFVEYE